MIEPEALPQRFPRAAHRRATVGGDFTVDEVEREHILSVLDRVPKIEDAAALLGIDASTLWRKRKKYEARDQGLVDSHPKPAATATDTAPKPP